MFTPESITLHENYDARILTRKLWCKNYDARTMTQKLWCENYDAKSIT